MRYEAQALDSGESYSPYLTDLHIEVMHHIEQKLPSHMLFQLDEAAQM